MRAISSLRNPQKFKEKFFKKIQISLFPGSIFFGSKGRDRFLDARGGAYPPPPMCVYNTVYARLIIIWRRSVKDIFL